MATSPMTVPLAYILSSEVLDAMGRLRHQDLKIKKTKGSRPRWVVRYTVPRMGEGGELVRCEERAYLGWCDEMTITEAKGVRDELRRTVNDTPTLIVGQAKFSMLAKAFEEKYLPALKANSQNSYRHCLNKHIIPQFGDMPLYKITNPVVQGWINSLMATHTKSTRGRLLGTLSSVFERAALWNWSQQRNPCLGVRLGEGGGKEQTRRALSVDEIRRMIGVADASDQELGQMIRVAVFTGARIGEILALTWGCYRPPVLTIKASMSQDGTVGSPKSAKGTREVPLTGVVLSRPVEASDSSRIFKSDYKAMEYALDKAARAAGIEYRGFGWHTFRYTYATLRKSMVNSPMRDQMGHSHESQSLFYVRPYFEDEVASSERILNVIMGEPEGRKQ